MKYIFDKYFLAEILCIFVSIGSLYSCDEKEDEQVQLIELICGTWVYDDASTREWIKNQYLPSGTFYTSYYDNSINEFHTNLDGTYILSNASIKGQYKLPSGKIQNVDWSIKTINGFDGHFIVNTAGGIILRFKKMIGEVSINCGDNISPDYEKLLPASVKSYENGTIKEDAKPVIKNFTAHNSKILEVDMRTGEITALSGGRTYVEIETSAGCAVIEVNVKENPLVEYINYIGRSKEEIVEILGEGHIEDNNQLSYSFPKKDFQYMFFYFDSWTNLVNEIKLSASPEITYSNEDIMDFLQKSFFPYERGTTENLKIYINHQEYEKATIGVEWMPNSKILIYRAISHDLFTDYSPFLGKNRVQMAEMMAGKKPYKDSQEEVVYTINDRYISRVVFSYSTTDGVFDDIQQVCTQLKSSINKDEVISFFNIKYEYVEAESNDESKIYLTANRMIKIKFVVNNNQIIYIKNK